jgi:hypothetical protein
VPRYEFFEGNRLDNGEMDICVVRKCPHVFIGMNCVVMLHTRRWKSLRRKEVFLTSTLCDATFRGRDINRSRAVHAIEKCFRRTIIFRCDVWNTFLSGIKPLQTTEIADFTSARVSIS